MAHWPEYFEGVSCGHKMHSRAIGSMMHFWCFTNISGHAGSGCQRFFEKVLSDSKLFRCLQKSTITEKVRLLPKYERKGRVFLSKCVSVQPLNHRNGNLANSKTE